MVNIKVCGIDPRHVRKYKRCSCFEQTEKVIIHIMINHKTMRI